VILYAIQEVVGFKMYDKIPIQNFRNKRLEELTNIEKNIEGMFESLEREYTQPKFLALSGMLSTYVEMRGDKRCNYYKRLLNISNKRFRRNR